MEKDAKGSTAPVVEVKRTRETKIEGDVVTAVRWTKKAETDPAPIRCEWKINFSGATREELLEIAAAEMVIRIQSDYRKGKAVAVQVVNVREMLDRERAAFTPTPDSLARQVDKLTPEQKKELLKKLGVK